jgi:putative effector of murein hydrolase
MPEFVQLWVYLASSPLFGLTATLGVYLLAQAGYVRMQQAPWANPVLWSVITLASGLRATGVAYPTYFAGAQFIHFLLGPAVVALACPLWERRNLIRTHWRALLLAALVGGAAASLSAVGMAWAMGLPADVVASLATKSVTAPVAMGIAEKVGGVPALAAVFASLTGILSALIGKAVLDGLGIERTRIGWMARGFALGTAGHGVGAARAMQVNPDAGAMAGLALGLQVVLATLVIPLCASLL